MLDILAVFHALLELAIDFGRVSGRKLLQPMLTALCLTGAYAAVHIGQEGSLGAGFRTAFLDSENARLERHRIEAQATLQEELRQFVAANKLINQILESIMLRAPGASRASLSVIHDGVTGMTGVDLLRYDDTNSVAAAGRLAATVVTNQPLSDWSDFLPDLLAGDCTFRRTGELRGLSLRARLESYGVTSLLVCPAADVQGKTVGAIFVMWDAHDQLPDASQIQGFLETGHHLGSQIAAVLDLRGPSPLTPTPAGN
ncbi:MAG TPA: hypothetical protein VFG62_13680 [Rhodopila sp.]|jgi:hypothetical protein|nr:hypothetical protein [Rhodopila sp.]